MLYTVLDSAPADSDLLRGSTAFYDVWKGTSTYKPVSEMISKQCSQKDIADRQACSIPFDQPAFMNCSNIHIACRPRLYMVDRPTLGNRSATVNLTTN